MAKIKSVWWRQDPLSRLTTLTIDDVTRQERSYRSWLAAARGISAKAAAEHIEKTRDYAFEPHASKWVATAARSEFFGDVEVRTIKPQRAGWHYDCGYLGDKPAWRRHSSSAAVTVYEVVADGQRIDGFLARPRAIALAKSLVAARIDASLARHPRALAA